MAWSSSWVGLGCTTRPRRSSTIAESRNCFSAALSRLIPKLSAHPHCSSARRVGSNAQRPRVVERGFDDLRRGRQFGHAIVRRRARARAGSVVCFLLAGGDKVGGEQEGRTKRDQGEQRDLAL